MTNCCIPNHQTTFLYLKIKILIILSSCTSKYVLETHRCVKLRNNSYSPHSCIFQDLTNFFFSINMRLVIKCTLKGVKYTQHGMLIVHFTVVYLVARPLNKSKAEVHLVMIQTLLLFTFKLLCYHAN